MSGNNSDTFQRIYDYLIAPVLLLSAVTPADWAFVFGRADLRVAEKTAELCGAGLIKRVLITGGIGKDSGPLADLALPESVYLAALLEHFYAVPHRCLSVEMKATNGGENSRFGMDLLMTQETKAQPSIVLVAHAPSLRRLYAAHIVEAEKLGFHAIYQLVATDYPFDPENPSDQAEAAAELLRLADWPAKGWSMPQDDLPEDLVAFAREFQANTTQ